jgi:flavin reductase (DIM6/NTAB) family NADH-FMN oxidoreductase RutF
MNGPASERWVSGRRRRTNTPAEPMGLRHEAHRRPHESGRDGAVKINPADLDYRQAHHLGASAMIPRPIVLVSTIGEDGIFNVAPMATITRVSMKPLLLGFEVGTRRDGRKKDTLRNIEGTGEFVVNVVHENLAEAMNQASCDYPSDVDEFKETGMTPVKADLVKAPMVGESPVKFECRLLQILKFGQAPRFCNFIIGEVLLVHIKDEFYVNGMVDSEKLKAIGRLGSDLYCRTSDIFRLEAYHRFE